MGTADLSIDPDEIVRRQLLAVDPPNESPCAASYWLSAQLVLRYLEADGISLTFPTSNQWQLGSVSFMMLLIYRIVVPIAFMGIVVIINGKAIATRITRD